MRRRTCAINDYPLPAAAGRRSHGCAGCPRSWTPARPAVLTPAARTPQTTAGSLAAIDLGIDIFQQQHATVEGENLAILRTRCLSRRADIVLAALGALEGKVLGRGRIGEIHHHAAARTLADHEGLLALAARIGLGA